MWKNRRLTYFSLIYWLFALNIRCVNIICWKTPSLHCLNLPIFDIKSSRLVSSHPNSWGKRLRQIKTDDGKYLCRRRTLCSVWETMKYQLIRKLLSSMNGRNVDDKDKDKEKWGEGARYLLLHVFKTSCLSNECKYFMQSSIQSPCLIMQSRTIEPRLVHQMFCYSNTQLNGLHHLFDKSSEHESFAEIISEISTDQKSISFFSRLLFHHHQWCAKPFASTFRPSILMRN